MDSSLAAEVEEAFKECFGEYARPLGSTDTFRELTVTLADDYAVPAEFRVAAYVEPDAQHVEDAWVVLQWTITELSPEIADLVAPAVLRAASTGAGYRFAAEAGTEYLVCDTRVPRGSATRAVLAEVANLQQFAALEGLAAAEAAADV